MFVCLFVVCFFGQCYSATKCPICGGLTGSNECLACSIAARVLLRGKTMILIVGLQHRNICTRAKFLHKTYGIIGERGLNDPELC